MVMGSSPIVPTMNLSPEHQAKLIEDRTEAIVKKHVLPTVLLEIDNNMRKHIFDALSFIYRDEIVKHIQKSIKPQLLDQFEITIKLKDPIDD